MNDIRAFEAAPVDALGRLRSAARVMGYGVCPRSDGGWSVVDPRGRVMASGRSPLLALARLQINVLRELARDARLGSLPDCAGVDVRARVSLETN